MGYADRGRRARVGHRGAHPVAGVAGLRRPRHRQAQVPFVKAAAARSTSTAMRRAGQATSPAIPRRYVVGSLLSLITLTLPFFTIRLGQTDAGNDPVGPTTRKSYDPLADGLRQGLQRPARDRRRARRQPIAVALPAFVRRMAADREVAFVVPQPSLNATTGHGDPDGVPHELAAGRRARRSSSTDCVDEVLPAAVAATGVRSVYVAGETAAFIDISDKITSPPSRVHRRGAVAVVPAADRRVPVDPGAAQGRAA